MTVIKTPSVFKKVSIAFNVHVACSFENLRSLKLKFPSDTCRKANLFFIQDKIQIKKGYDRIKAKVKAVRQEYRTAVTTGRRSGSGKLVADNWDTLKLIWGGSPAAVQIPNAAGHIILDEENNDDDDNDDDDNDDEISTETDDVLNMTPVFVDKKRKHLEKQLSANQRDNVYLDIAKRDLVMKQNMSSNLSNAMAESSEAFKSFSKSIENAGKSIGDGLAMLANALGGQMAYAQQQHHSVQGYHQARPYGYPPHGYNTNVTLQDPIDNNNNNNNTNSNGSVYHHF